jgi:multicomponent Na+:H+ antiporter subunit B
MIELVDAALLIFMAVITLVIIRHHGLFTVVMLSGIFSLLSAGLFTVMDAVDVAFTEASVGAGISTVLMLGAIALTSNEEKVVTNGRLLGLAVALGVGAVLIYGLMDLPAFGDAAAPIHHHVAPTYIASAGELDIPNMVTTVLASYRGYDTLGETTVVMTAAIGVLLLLGGKGDEEDAS